MEARGPVCEDPSGCPPRSLSGRCNQEHPKFHGPDSGGDPPGWAPACRLGPLSRAGSEGHSPQRPGREGLTAAAVGGGLTPPASRHDWLGHRTRGQLRAGGRPDFPDAPGASAAPPAASGDALPGGLGTALLLRQPSQTPALVGDGEDCLSQCSSAAVTAQLSAPPRQAHQPEAPLPSQEGTGPRSPVGLNLSARCPAMRKPAWSHELG